MVLFLHVSTGLPYLRRKVFIGVRFRSACLGKGGAGFNLVLIIGQCPLLFQKDTGRPERALFHGFG